MKVHGWALSAVALAAACTGRITGSSGPSGGGAPAASTGAGGAPDTTIAPPGTTPTMVDPTDPNAAMTCMPSIAPAPVRRLSYAEYEATTADLLGSLAPTSVTLTRDPNENGFENRANLLNPSPALVEEYGDEAIAAGLAVSTAMPSVLPCTPATAADEAACGVQFIQQFGAKAFRRPLTADELTDFTTFFEGERANSNFQGAVQLTTETFLQSPQFLYRLELGDPATAAADRIKLTSYEIASRLSYLMWGSAPDDTLMAAAAANGLDDATAREAQVRRLLADPRAGAMMVEFHRQWLAFDQLSAEPKDPATYPQYDATLEAAIRQESDRFVTKVMWQGPGTLAAFLTSTDTQVNAPLAALYGVPAPTSTSGWADVTLDPSQRAGFLTRANFLAGRAHQLEGSPPLRSVFIRNRLLCLPPLMPPANADLSEPKATAGAMAQTNRQLFEARVAPAACAGCHAIINPMGYGLENYDAIGAYRTTDDGLPVDASGAIIGSGDVDGPFTGGVQLSQKLAQSKTVAACATSTWYSYAVGRDLATADTCRVAKLNLALSTAGGDVREMLVAIATSPEFIYRTPVMP